MGTWLITAMHYVSSQLCMTYVIKSSACCDTDFLLIGCYMPESIPETVPTGLNVT